MRKLLVVLIGSFSSLACASDIIDMGAFGKTYPVAEQDIVEFIKERLMVMQEEGVIDRKHQELLDKSRGYANRPPGRTLPTTLEYRNHVFDPTVTIQRDIADADGNVIYPAGTVINPLDYRGLSKTLCFIDGDDRRQVEWLNEMCPYQKGFKHILVNGSAIELSKEQGSRFYFDQHGTLVDRFAIEHVPAVVRQSGKVLYVEEYPVE